MTDSTTPTSTAMSRMVASQQRACAHQGERSGISMPAGRAAKNQSLSAEPYRMKARFGPE